MLQSKDDGLGFDMSESHKEKRKENHGFGLTTMKERIFAFWKVNDYIVSR